MAQAHATFHCQACRARLDLRGDADAPSERRGIGPAALMNALEGGAIDESFIVLPDSARRGGAPPGRLVDTVVGLCLSAAALSARALLR